MEDPVHGYDANAAQLAARYEALSSEQVHAAVLDLFPPAGAALDVGAGSGRDAAWLDGRGFEVVAVEPSAQLRRAAAALHSAAGVRWLDDRLPELNEAYALDRKFDLILLSGVWMHVHPSERPRAFMRLSGLLRTGGLLLISVRNGPGGPGRPMWDVDPAELADFARTERMTLLRQANGPDHLGRLDVAWASFAFRASS